MNKLWQIIIAVLLLLLPGIFAGGCVGPGSDFTLKVIPPHHLQLPLHGTWEIISPLSQETAVARDLVPNWVGKTLYFSDKQVLLGEYLLQSPRYQVKKVAAEAYLFYRHQVFPQKFHFQGPDIEVLTLSDNQLFFCELLRVGEDKLWLNLFNNGYLAQKISDEVDETVFPPGDPPGEKSETAEVNNPAEIAGNRSGVLLGLRSPGEEQRGNTGDSYRTLWLAQTGLQLAPVLEINTLIFPRISGFYRLQVIRKKEDKIEEDFLIVDHILRTEEEDYGQLLFPDPSVWAGKEGCIMRRIGYIGEDYISVEETTKQVSVDDGGRSEQSRLHIFAVDSLPVMKAVKISDLAGPDAAVAMEQGGHKLRQQSGLKQMSLPDEYNFGLARKMGYWVFNGRADYRENNTVKTADYIITIIPPEHLVCHNKLHIPWTRVKTCVPTAIDVFTSPAKDLALLVTNNEIIVYGMHRDNLAGPPLQRIPLREDEEVIMAEWALGHYVENWTITFETYLAQEMIFRNAL